MEIILATTPKHYFDVMYIRQKVFVEEQNVIIDEEFDGKDAQANHVVLYVDGKAVSSCRYFLIDDYYKIGRLATLVEYRGKGYGKMILDFVEEFAQKNEVEKLKLGAQLRVAPFYEKLGFEAYGDIYYDANIKHINMVKKI